MSAELSVTQSDADNVCLHLAGTGLETWKTCAMRGLMRAGARVRLIGLALVRLAGPSGTQPPPNAPPCPMESGFTPLSMRLALQYAPSSGDGTLDFDRGGGGRIARLSCGSQSHSVWRNLFAMAWLSFAMLGRVDADISYRKKKEAELRA